MQLAGAARKSAGFTLLEIMVVVAIIGFVLAIGMPNLMRARDTAQVDVCFSNMRLIHAAIQRWAVENNKAAGDAVTADDLMPYYAKNKAPVCPGGGNYILKTVNDKPECTKASNGHVY